MVYQHKTKSHHNQQPRWLSYRARLCGINSNGAWFATFLETKKSLKKFFFFPDWLQNGTNLSFLIKLCQFHDYCLSLTSFSSSFSTLPLSVSTLSLSLTHTHTHTHTLSLSHADSPTVYLFIQNVWNLSFKCTHTHASQTLSPLSLSFSLSLSQTHTQTHTHTLSHVSFFLKFVNFMDWLVFKLVFQLNIELRILFRNRSMMIDKLLLFFRNLLTVSQIFSP